MLDIIVVIGGKVKGLLQFAGTFDSSGIWYGTLAENSAVSGIRNCDSPPIT
ncbi:MAG: hypothetical protein IT203_10245 [Fimbriimonadaceae bacterium]|nr:hypothetical protein [Fimbriimonadaceae bacterium]